MHSHGRVTLVARENTKPDMDWNYSRPTSRNVAFVDNVASLRFALDAAVTEVGLDVGRVIVDRAGDANAFLELLTAMPGEFTGDALLIRDDGSGFLSASGRGGDRVLYALTVHDIRFYLETHNLVTGRVAMGMTA
jgi:hypothetical protein